MGFFAGYYGVIKLFVIYLIFTGTVVGVLEFNESGDNHRIVLSCLCWIPLLIATHVLHKEYGSIMFDDDKSNDKKIKLFNLIAVSIVWIISWANIFLVFWAWDQTSWSNLTSIHAFDAWLRLLSTTLLIIN